MSALTGLVISGRLATPEDSDWDQSRAAWNLAAEQRPAAVAFIESTEDAVKVIRFAAAHDLRIAGQGTGHGAFALGPLEDTILVKTERLREIQIDAEARIA
jgi:FAD/FMN-containing dehydrogenase